VSGENVGESVRAAMGRKVVDRSTAEELGSVAHVVVDASRRALRGIVIGRGKRAMIVDWADLNFGPDAVMVAGPESVREPSDDQERAAAGGAHDLIGRRALSRLGNQLGAIDDVIFGAEGGELREIVVGGHPLPAASLLGLGSYACVLADDFDPRHRGPSR